MWLNNVLKKLATQGKKNGAFFSNTDWTSCLILGTLLVKGVSLKHYGIAGKDSDRRSDDCFDVGGGKSVTLGRPLLDVASCKLYRLSLGR